MNPLKSNLKRLHQNLDTLREREAKYGGDAPIALLNEIADTRTAISLTEQALRGQLALAELGAKLAKLNIDHTRMESTPMELSPPPLSTYQVQRLRAIERQIQQRLELLREYEDLLAVEDDPRRKRRYRQEIEREKAALEDFRQQAAALGISPDQAGSAPVEAVQDGLAAMSHKLDDLGRKLDDHSQQVETGQQALHTDLARQQQAILAHVDQSFQSVVAAIVQRLDANQAELVELLLDAADRQQLSQWEADELTRLVQQSLLELRRLHQNRPDAGQWQRLLDLLEQDVGWEQKLRLTLPLVPGLLEYESEIQVDVMGVLNESWRRLLRKIGR